MSSSFSLRPSISSYSSLFSFKMEDLITPVSPTLAHHGSTSIDSEMEGGGKKEGGGGSIHPIETNDGS